MAQLPQAGGRHRYAPADYGLTAEQVDDAFRPYTELSAANKIRMR